MLTRTVKRLCETRYLPGVFLCVLTLLIGIWFLPDYGISIDEPLHHDAGEINVTHYWGSSDQIESYGNLRFYGPLSDIIGYLSAKFWSRYFGISAIESWHIHYILFFCGSVFLFYSVARFWWSGLCAVLCTLLLMLTPRILGHVPINPKSIPFYFWSLLLLFCLQRWIENRTRVWLIATGCVSGLCFATRFHAVLIISALMIWMLVLEFKRDDQTFETTRLLRLKDLFFLGVSGLGTTYLCWPWLRNHPVTGWIDLITFFSSHPKPGYVLYFGKVYQIGSTPWHYAPAYFLLTTPVSILILSVIGWLVLKSNSSSSNHRPFLVLTLWLVFAALPFSFPGAVVYDGPRHMLLVYPPLLLLAGYGLYRGIQFVQEHLPGIAKQLGWLLGVMVIGQLLIVNHLYHPYQMVYYNCLVGGVQGAADRLELWSWGHSMRQVSEKINAIAEPGARVYVSYPKGLAEYSLRGDLQVTSIDPDYVVTTTFREPQNIPSNFTLVETVDVRGVVLNRIYKKNASP